MADQSIRMFSPFHAANSLDKDKDKLGKLGAPLIMCARCKFCADFNFGSLSIPLIFFYIVYSLPMYAEQALSIYAINYIDLSWYFDNLEPLGMWSVLFSHWKLLA